MNELDNRIFFIAYIISNVLGIVFLISSFTLPRLSRLLYAVLFGWASWANWSMVINNPQDYLSYADLTFLTFYRSFILGWFKDHVQLSVGLIATVQALIAISLLMKGRVYKLGLLGGILFLVAIIPLGVGSAFPCTVLLAAGLVMLRNEDTWLWQSNSGNFTMSIE
ncbi:MAG TPA: hypothetical protein VKA49_08750 [Flavitalea sp.]|nr:hypothetical protein [Flavitalea sp.]